MKRFALLLGGLFSGAAGAADWHTEIDANGLRSAWTSGEVAIGATAATAEATLRYKCAPGVRGNLIWSLEIAHADKIRIFDFDDFEGPDAMANGRKLSALALVGGLLQAKVLAAQTGYYAGAPSSDTFVIETSAPAREPGDLALLTDLIGPGTSAIEWRVTSARDPELALAARFDAAGADRALAQARIGCGPPPALKAETVQAWVGQDPNAMGVFDHAALLWRLKALLGRDFDTFRLAIADAQPVARDGDVVYVVGHLRGDPKLAAAWMIDLKTLVSEAALVESGRLRTIRDEDAPRITPPEAVRSYLSAAL